MRGCCRRVAVSGAGGQGLSAGRVLSLCRKECLVSSSGNDNTENGLAGSKAEQKAPPKA